jgi:hypothetical protein
MSRAKYGTQLLDFLRRFYRTIWWVILVGFLTCLLYWRGDFLGQSSAVIDVVIFIAWLALLLAPLFQEVSILGLTVKKEIKPLSGHPSVKITVENGNIEEDALE